MVQGLFLREKIGILSIGGTNEKKIVVRSINNFDKNRCIDIFKREDNSFGYEEYRRDAETNEGWYTVGFLEELIFTKEEEAYTNACKNILWLNIDH